MITDDSLLGYRKSDPRALKPLKVRIPLEHVLRLHELRIMGDRSVSQIVAQALEDYMAGLQQPKPRDKEQEPKS